MPYDEKAMQETGYTNSSTKLKKVLPKKAALKDEKNKSKKPPPRRIGPQSVLDDIQAEKLRFWMPVCEENIFPPRALGKNNSKEKSPAFLLKQPTNSRIYYT
jgi:hypothetical protein